MILFDQYSRYKAAADLIRVNLTPTGGRIVDIGCGADCLLATFLTEEEITFVDPLLACRMPGKATVTELPRPGCKAIAEGYSEHSRSGTLYDCVVAIDTYEHIPALERRLFLESILSLSNDTVVLGFPSCDTPDALDVDNAVDDCFRAHYGHSYSWLQEHRDYGLPSHEEAVKFFNSHGWTTSVLNHGNPEWLKALLPMIVCLWEEPTLRELAFNISEPFNNEFAPLDLGCAVGYRKFIVAKKNGTPVLPVNVNLDRSNTQEAWQKFLKQVDFNILQQLLSNVRKENSSGQSIGSLSRNDKEIVRLNTVVESASTSLVQLMNNLQNKDQEILRLNGVVESSSSAIKKLMQDVENRDLEILRLQKVVAQASEDIIALSQKSSGG